jgi:hypothetical protein
MLILVVAIVAGLGAGYALGGRLRNLENLKLRMSWLVILALTIQFVIFSPLGEPFGEAGVIVLHLVSYALLIAFAIVNWRDIGLRVAGLGITLNAIVIAANGGFMPASRTALEFAGFAVSTEPHNNSVLADDGVRLLFLGDIMSVPHWVPLIANVFSVGDLLITVGVATMLAAAMRRPAPVESADAQGAKSEWQRRHHPGSSPEPDIELALDALAASVSRLTAFCAAACTDASDKALGATVALLEACETLIAERAEDPDMRALTMRTPGIRRAAVLHTTDGEPEAR